MKTQTVYLKIINVLNNIKHANHMKLMGNQLIKKLVNLFF